MAVINCDTPLLRVAYMTDGSDAGTAILLLHGWPDDAHAFRERQSSICRAPQRSMRHWLIESMNVPIHLLLQRCGPDPTRAGRR